MIGAIVLATDQGLGYLAKDFYDNGVFDKVLIKRHSHRVNHTDWYKDWKWLSKENYEWFFEGLDAVIYIEEPHEWRLLIEARERGIKNVFIPMYECTRSPFPYQPDVTIAVSDLDQDYFPNSKRINIPVSVKWKQRKKALHFVHNAGNGGLGGRNGTKELIEAIRHVKSPIKLTIRTQEIDFKCDDERVTIIRGTVPKEELYNGDVFIFPEKFNGLSLPLQEAFASGMAVMASDRYPMNKWLPNEILIPVKGYKKEKIAVEFDYAIIDPLDIAKTIDDWYGKDITELSLKGKKFNQDNSWKKLKKHYEVPSLTTIHN